MASTRTPAKHFSPLAIGAPEPYRSLPVKLERMIHFVPSHNDKIRAKIKELASQVDVVLGNLEDAVPLDQKENARKGFIEMVRDNDFGSTGVWTRINCLNSPWVLDDMTEIVAKRRQQARRHHAAEGRRAVGHPLPRSAAGAARSQARGQEADPDPRHSRNGRRRQ